MCGYSKQALDSMRVIGNNAVHPGEMTLHEDPDTPAALFTILNYIVEQLIALPDRLVKGVELADLNPATSFGSGNRC